MFHFGTPKRHDGKASSFVPLAGLPRQGGGGAAADSAKGEGASGNAMVNKWKWYAARLAAMSPAEVLHRLLEMRRKAVLARIANGWAAFPPVLVEFPQLNLIRERLAAADIDAVEDCPLPQNLLGKSWQGQFRRNGLPLPDAWFFDPVSQRHWPGAEASAFDVDVRSTSAVPHAARPFGDVKFVWEFNRLQVLQPLACVIAKEGCDGPAFERALQWIEHWMIANPPYRGVNWSSGIEIGLRIASVSLIVAAAGQAMPEHGRRLIAQFLHAHARWLAALPSLHSSANNHRVAEGLGLLLAGLLLGAEGDGRNHEREGRAILEAEASNQFHGDGVGVEQSPTYQAFSMELIAFGAVMAVAAGQPLAKSVYERLHTGARFLSALQDIHGNVPAIGDDDEGRVLVSPGAEEPHYVASVTACVAALCNDIQLPTRRPGYFRERLFAVLQRRQPAMPALMHSFSEGGYDIVREERRGRAMHLVFDHGPLGLGTLAAHGHADALSIWLSVDGQPLFVDAGTWLYHSGEDVRMALRRSMAHNTMSIDDVSQSEPSAAFSWSSKAAARARAVPDGTAVDWGFCGEHDGYLRRFGVIHRRIVRATDTGFALDDSLGGIGKTLPVSIGFTLAPDVIANIGDRRIVLERHGTNGPEALLHMTVPEGFRAELARAESGGGRGVISTKFGHLEPTPHILLRGTLSPQSDGVTTEIHILPPTSQGSST